MNYYKTMISSDMSQYKTVNYFIESSISKIYFFVTRMDDRLKVLTYM